MISLGLNLTAAQRAARVDDYCRESAWRWTKHRYPHEFSGGKTPANRYFRALAVNPKLIICDEPQCPGCLDPGRSTNLLLDLQRDFGGVYLFITHDLSIVPHLAHRIRGYAEWQNS